MHDIVSDMYEKNNIEMKIVYEVNEQTSPLVKPTNWLLTSIDT